jgi:hypothetical protein
VARRRPKDSTLPFAGAIARTAVESATPAKTLEAKTPEAKTPEAWDLQPGKVAPTGPTKHKALGGSAAGEPSKREEWFANCTENGVSRTPDVDAACSPATSAGMISDGRRIADEDEDEDGEDSCGASAEMTGRAAAIAPCCSE